MEEEEKKLSVYEVVVLGLAGLGLFTSLVEIGSGVSYVVDKFVYFASLTPTCKP